MHCHAQQSLKSDLKSSRRAAFQEKATSLQESLPEAVRLAVNLAQEKGAFIWLTALPIAEHDFALHKSDFRDALALRTDGSQQDCLLNVYVVLTS